MKGIKMIFLIDGENIHMNTLNNLDFLANQDTIYYFYSKRVPSISCDFINYIVSHPEQVKLVECKSDGKNALDFQLTAFLGMLVASIEDVSFTVVSKDKEYESAIDFLNEQCSNRVVLKNLV